jgi:Pyruvate/2-oxoacid:ferredoxin oxidoreductase delta subunit
VIEALARSGLRFTAVEDLCERAARRDPALARLARAKGLRVVACFPRAVRWLFAAAGAPLAAEGVEFFNLRTQTADEILAGLVPAESAGGNPQSKIQNPKSKMPVFPARQSNQWIPWFPVIDYDRCKDCRQCLQFCLFGVYAADAAGKVRVAQPDHCKTGCPACARLCPQAAIIFPKFADAPINGDDAPAAVAAATRPAAPIDFSSLAGLDLHEALRRRSALLKARQEGRRE